MTLFFRALAIFAISAAIHGCGGGGSDSPPPPPSAIAAVVSLDEDTNVDGTLRGTPADGGALTFSVTSQPTNGTLTASAASYTYTPNTDYFGSDSFAFTVTENGRTSSPATISITVNPVNDDPVVAATTETTDEDVVLQADVDASDVDGDELVVTVVDEPTNGSVTLAGGVSYSYEPAQDFFGQDSFTFTIDDGTVTSAITSVTIDVASVNDAPVLVSENTGVEAGSALTVDLSGTDVENDSLTYTIASDFTQATVTNDATASGVFDIDVPYGSFGTDVASIVANDGMADSNTATIELDITVPQTTPTTTFQIYDGGRSLSIGAFVEGPNDSLYVFGDVLGGINSTGTIDPPELYVGIHDASGARINIAAEMGNGLLSSGAAGFNGDLFTAIGVYRDNNLMVQTIGLDTNDMVAVSEVAFVPYSISRANRRVRPVHVPGVGFYLLANDNQLTWVDYTGTIQSTVAIPAPISDLVQGYDVQDVRIIDDVVYLAGMVFECVDDGSQCFPGLGTKGFVLTVDMSGTPLAIVELTDAPRDVAILNDGGVAVFADSRLKRVDSDGMELWSRASLGSRGLVGTSEQGDIFLWTYDQENDTGNMEMMRVSMDNALIWETIEQLGLDNDEGIFGNDMSVDRFGNSFLSVVVQGPSPNEMITIHFDYSGEHQWSDISVPGNSIISGNGMNARRSFLSSNYRYISVAVGSSDNGSPDDGFVFFTSIDPAPE